MWKKNSRFADRWYGNYVYNLTVYHKKQSIICSTNNIILYICEYFVFRLLWCKASKHNVICELIQYSGVGKYKIAQKN